MRISVPARGALALALILGAGLTACDDLTAPEADFDPQSTAEAMETMVAASEDLGAAFGSLEAAGGLFTDEGAAMLRAGGPAADASALRAFAGSPAAAYFPSNYLGVTFAWNASDAAYVPTELEGAPEDGIRVLYYAVDPFTQEPVDVESPLGRIDLRDLSSASSDRLGVMVVRTADGEATLADYFVDASWATDQQSIEVDLVSEGYLSNGEERLDFDLAQSVLLSETAAQFSQDYDMWVGNEIRVHYVGAISGMPGSEDGGAVSLEVSVEHAGATAVFDIDATAEGLDGTVQYGGVAVAHISGTAEEPVFTDASGEQVDPAELEALRVIFGALNGLFEVAAGIFGPAAS